MRKTIKKYVAGAFMVALFGIYAGYQSISPLENGTTTAPVATAAITPESTGALSTAVADAATHAATDTVHASDTSSAAQTVSEPAAAPVITKTPTAATHTQSGYTDGVYTGASENAFYGNVQVEVTVSGGKITDVVALDVPSGHHESQQINSRAIPKLRSEVISAQSSNVNAVSGATYTSLAYKQSVASALAQA